jgi:hypothetical protein
MVFLYMAPDGKRKRPPGRDLMHELYGAKVKTAEFHHPTKSPSVRIKNSEP